VVRGDTGGGVGHGMCLAGWWRVVHSVCGGTWGEGGGGVEGMVWDCYKQDCKKVLVSTWRSFLPSSVQILQPSCLQYIIFK
jgi:hypothetical protein